MEILADIRFKLVTGERLDAWIDESVFCFEEMNKACRASMALDGIEDVVDGKLIYTDVLLEKS